MLCALDYANEQWTAGVRPPKGVFRLRFAEAIGDGFAAGSEARVATVHALVQSESFEDIADEYGLTAEQVIAADKFEQRLNEGLGLAA